MPHREIALKPWVSRQNREIWEICSPSLEQLETNLEISQILITDCVTKILSTRNTPSVVTAGNLSWQAPRANPAYQNTERSNSVILINSKSDWSQLESPFIMTLPLPEFQLCILSTVSTTIVKNNFIKKLVATYSIHSGFVLICKASSCSAGIISIIFCIIDLTMNSRYYILLFLAKLKSSPLSPWRLKSIPLQSHLRFDQQSQISTRNRIAQLKETLTCTPRA